LQRIVEQRRLAEVAAVDDSVRDSFDPFRRLE
jgi:hypothetical protein